jgi:hypothetical protein
VQDGASDDEIKQALKDAGALGKRQKFYGAQSGHSDFNETAQARSGADFGELFHGTPVAFEGFRDPTATKDRGAGYDHQGPAVYLTNDAGGYARFFARESGARLALKLAGEGKAKESNAIADGDGVVLSVKLDPSAKILRLEDAPQAVKDLFEKSVGNKNVGKSLRATVIALGYDGLAFTERNFPEGWEVKNGATTVALYDHTKATVTSTRPAAELRKSARKDLLGDAPNESQQAAAKLQGEKAEREQRQQQDAPAADDFKLTGSDRKADEGDAAGQGSLLRRGDGRFVGEVSVERARKIVDEVKASWKNGPPIHVVGTYRELPGEQPAGTRGLYRRNEVWIAAHEHAQGESERQAVMRTLAHEAVAHYGLRELLGRDGWAELTKNINLAAASGNKPLREIRDYVRATYRNDDGSYALAKHPGIEADEIAARVVEKAIDENGNFRPGFSFLKATFARIVQFLRGIGIDVKFTTAELQGMLVLSMKHLETGHRMEGRPESLAVAARAEPDQQSRPVREEGFPRDLDHLHATRDLADLKSHARYREAKAGDVAAAVDVVRDVIPQESVDEARDRFGAGAIYASPMAIEATGKNALPQALAARLAAQTGGTVDRGIVQSNKAHHTGAKAMERLISRPLFDGPVQKGGRYVLVDDVLTSGSTLAEMADHIRAGGGEVVGTYVIANVARDVTMDPRRQDVRAIKERYGEQVRQLFQLEPEALTAAEARYIIGHRDAAELAGRAASAHEERAARLRAKGVLPGEGVKPADDFDAKDGQQARSLPADALTDEEKRVLPPQPPGHSMIEGARDFASNILREGQMFAAPMGAGTEKARAVAQTSPTTSAWRDAVAAHRRLHHEALHRRAAPLDVGSRGRGERRAPARRPPTPSTSAPPAPASHVSPRARPVERLHDYGEELLQRAVTPACSRARACRTGPRAWP